MREEGVSAPHTMISSTAVKHFIPSSRPVFHLFIKDNIHLAATVWTRSCFSAAD